MKVIPLQADRPSLFDLWTIYQFHTGRLSIQAKVPPGTVAAMLSHQPVKRSEAQKVLDTLSLLLHKDFTLDTVYVALTPEAGHDQP